MTAAAPQTPADALEAALGALAGAYADALTAIAATPDGRAAFAGAVRVGEVLRELSQDAAAVRAAITADVRARLIRSAVHR